MTRAVRDGYVRVEYWSHAHPVAWGAVSGGATALVLWLALDGLVGALFYAAGLTAGSVIGHRTRIRSGRWDRWKASHPYPSRHGPQSSTGQS